MTLPQGYSLPYPHGVMATTLLYKMLYRRRFLSFAALGASAFTAAATIGWNVQLAVIINAVSGGQALTNGMFIGALLSMAVISISSGLKAYLSGGACESMGHDLRMAYARFFAELPMAEAEKLNTGKQLSKMQNELAGVNQYVSANLFQLMDDAMRFLVTFGWLLVLDPVLTVGVNLPVPLLMAYVFWSSKIIGSATEHSQQAKGQMNRHADTLLTLFPVIHLYDALPMTRNRYNNAVKAWENHTVRAERTRARLMSLSGLISQLPLLLLWLMGGYRVMAGLLDIGTLYLFLNLSGNVSGVLMNAPGYIANYRQFAANLKRLLPYVSFADTH